MAKHLEVDPKKFKACMACNKACPTEAISGKPKSPQKIDTKKMYLLWKL